MNPKVRRLVRETDLNPRHLIAPFFVVEGKGVRNPIASMPGIFQVSSDELCRDVARMTERGLGGVILFGVPSAKDERASQAYAADGVVQKALQVLAEKVPNALRISDVCLCEYTSHGHCGLLQGESVANDPTLELLAKTALSHVRAGSELVAPSDMMDHRIGAIRKTLDENHFENIPVMSYAVKYASAFYGPFRQAAQSTPAFGDRRSYQMDSANAREAMKEVELDIAEGADILMVKPAGYYLDIVREVKQQFHIPVAAYQVSGEYAMMHAAAEKGFMPLEAMALESLVSIRRAGADFILTYFADTVLDLLGGG